MLSQGLSVMMCQRGQSAVTTFNKAPFLWSDSDDGAVWQHSASLNCDSKLLQDSISVELPSLHYFKISRRDDDTHTHTHTCWHTCTQGNYRHTHPPTHTHSDLKSTHTELPHMSCPLAKYMMTTTIFPFNLLAPLLSSYRFPLRLHPDCVLSQVVQWCLRS